MNEIVEKIRIRRYSTYYKLILKIVSYILIMFGIEIIAIVLFGGLRDDIIRFLSIGINLGVFFCFLILGVYALYSNHRRIISEIK